MVSGPLAEPDFRGQFSGHETFPLRYGWLNKVFDAVSKTKGKKNASLFSKEDAIVSFGVGKNMVASMKHWGLASGIMEESDIGFRISKFGHLLMGPNGLDPYLEASASLWLIHWKLASEPNRTTTWYWAFNCYSGLVFDQERLTTGLAGLCHEKAWLRISQTTLKRDVECFIKTYSNSNRSVAQAVTEDSLESPLCELALVRPTGFRGGYQFQRGPKLDLPDTVFVFALDSFWRQRSNARTLTVEAITFDAGSPGRVFKLDEDAVSERLTRIEDASGGTFRWTDAAGLRQVARVKERFNGYQFLRAAPATKSGFRRAA